jgi:hypothetical protein
MGGRVVGEVSENWGGGIAICRRRMDQKHCATTGMYIPIIFINFFLLNIDILSVFFHITLRRLEISALPDCSRHNKIMNGAKKDR